VEELEVNRGAKFMATVSDAAAAAKKAGILILKSKPWTLKPSTIFLAFFASAAASLV
jgi:hypothetical protein